MYCGMSNTETTLKQHIDTLDNWARFGEYVALAIKLHEKRGENVTHETLMTRFAYTRGEFDEPYVDSIRFKWVAQDYLSRNFGVFADIDSHCKFHGLRLSRR